MIIVRKPVAGLSEESFGRFVRRAAQAVALPGSLNVLLTTNAEMKRLNQRFRGKSSPTDVLSFPPMSESLQGLAGDIAISAEMAARNGRRLGHSVAEEVKILALHGIMHLAGYDHERDKGKMARKEQQLRKSMRLPTGLIERSTTKTSKGTRVAKTARGRSSRRRSKVARRRS